MIFWFKLLSAKMVVNLVMSLVFFAGLFISKLSAVDIMRIIEMYIAACGDGICNEGFKNLTHQVPNISLNSSFICPRCSCKTNCMLFGNCCPDLFFKLHPACVNTILLHDDVKSSEQLSYLMIDKCPGDSFGNGTIQLCENTYELEQQLQNIPVTSVKSSLTYRNIHCSKCYNESESDVVFGRLQIDCEQFADFNFLSTYGEIKQLAAKRDCIISYVQVDSMEHQSRPCTISSPNSNKISVCNVTGTWTKYDADIDFSCRTYDNPYRYFKNVFCYMCNPPKQTLSVISQCNVTGDWDTYDEEMESACQFSIRSAVTTPFKNVFCYMCNRNNTKIESGLKFNDINIAMSESKSEQYFNYWYNILSVDLDMIKTELEAEGFEDQEATSNFYDTNSTTAPNLDILDKKITYQILNMTNIYRQFYAYEGSIGFCQNMSKFKNQQPCNCGRPCHFTGKACCIDKLFGESTMCTNKSISVSRGRYLTYASCENNSHYKIRHLCEQSQSEKLLSILPVEIKIDEKHIIYLKNIYCLMCNEKLLHSSPRNEVQFWRIHITCNLYIQPTYYLSFRQYFDYTRHQGCNYTIKPYNSGLQCSDNFGNRCNATGNWYNEDSDIEYACERINMPRSWFRKGNPFCGTCNPRRWESILYTSCNVTGLWQKYDQGIEDDCYSMPEIQSLFPFKNIFCKICNERSFPPVIDIPKIPNIQDEIKFTDVLVAMHQSFRTIFSLSSYDDGEKGEQPGMTCKRHQVFDTIKHQCRDIKCYPGRILTNKGCVPLLPITNNLGYILSVELQIQLQSSVNNTLQFMNTVRDEFHSLLGFFLQLSLQYESSYYHTDMQCSEEITWMNGTSINIVAFEKIFITSYINRSDIENKLVDLTSQKVRVSYMNSTYDFDIQSTDRTFIFPILIDKIGFSNHCFVKKSNYFPKANEYVYTNVGNLIRCKQVELNQTEYTLDTLSLIVTANGVVIGQDEYILLSKKRIRICLEKFYLILKANRSDNMVQNVLGIMMMVCTVVSLICLFLTFITYCLFRKLRSLPGKNNMCLVFAMFSAHSLFQFGLYATDFKIGCMIIGVLIHYFWLSTFGCLNICCFHMFRVFRSKTLSNFSEKSHATKVLIQYVAYSFGMPIIIVSVNALVNILTTDSFGYGGKMCFLNKFIPVIVFFIAPITIVCLLNIFFFAVTSIKIASVPKIEEEARMSNRVQFFVYIKLFTITGITWIFQVVDSFLPLSLFSTIVSLLNALQGVFIFLSYMCNKRVAVLYKAFHSSSTGHTSQTKTATTSFDNTDIPIGPGKTSVET